MFVGFKKVYWVGMLRDREFLAQKESWWVERIRLLRIKDHTLHRHSILELQFRTVCLDEVGERERESTRLDQKCRLNETLKAHTSKSDFSEHWRVSSAWSIKNTDQCQPHHRKTLNWSWTHTNWIRCLPFDCAANECTEFCRWREGGEKQAD